MTRETVEWLLWLVGQQTIQLGAPDARAQAEAAWRALGELEALTGGSPRPARGAAMSNPDNP